MKSKSNMPSRSDAKPAVRPKGETLYRMPAEWEPHEGTFVSWPHFEPHWPGKLSAIPPVYKKIIQALVADEKVFVLVNDAKMEQDAKAALLSGDSNLTANDGANFASSMPNVQFLHIPTNASWCRDYGPIFVKDANGGLAIEDWIFNAWGDKWPWDLDNLVAQKAAKIFKIPLVKPDIVLEGGSIDVNGAGCVLTTEQCLLNKNRNPKLNRGEIEEYLGEYLGAPHVLWLREGIVGDDTDGHIDDIARFADAQTIMCAIEENKRDENYEILRKNFQDLEKMRDQNGRKFNVVALPMPNPVIYENQRLPASYANFYIANRSVLVPTFRNRRDESALKIFEKLFAGRKIVPIDCFDLIWGLGAIHCSTQQMPRCM